MPDFDRKKRGTLEERLTPCQCCGYPLSQRHHLFERSEFGETDYVALFCANCHELYHICESVAFDKSFSGEAKGRNALYFNYLSEDRPELAERIKFMTELIERVENAKIEFLCQNPLFLLANWGG